MAQDSIVYFNGTEWNYIPKGDFGGINNMKANNGKLVISLDWGGKIYNEDVELDYTIWSYNPGSPSLNDAVNGLSQGEVWIADNSKGLVKSWGGGYESMFINPGGPLTANVTQWSTTWLRPRRRLSSCSSMMRSCDGRAIRFFVERQVLRTWRKYTPRL